MPGFVHSTSGIAVIYIIFVIAVPVSSAKSFLRQGQTDRTVNLWIAVFLCPVHILVLWKERCLQSGWITKLPLMLSGVMI